MYTYIKLGILGIIGYTPFVTLAHQEYCLPIVCVCSKQTIFLLNNVFKKTNIFVEDYTLVSREKYFAKNFELCEQGKLIFCTAFKVPNLHYNRQNCSFWTAIAVQINKLSAQRAPHF